MIPVESVQELQSAVDGDVQAAYSVYLEQGDIDGAKELKEFTGIEPKISKKSVQKGYDLCFECGWISSAKELKEFTGIEPSEELLKKYPQYAEALK